MKFNDVPIKGDIVTVSEFYSKKFSVFSSLPSGMIGEFLFQTSCIDCCTFVEYKDLHSTVFCELLTSVGIVVVQKYQTKFEVISSIEK